MKRWAVYARYSSDRQNPKSCEDQIRECEERISALGGMVVKRYADEAVSGAHEIQRPQYLSMVTAMKAGVFDCLMAEDMDRLNRNLEASARLYSLATRDNVEIWTLSDGKVSQIHTGLRGLMGEMFLQQLADKTRRGMSAKARQNLAMGALCFGYRGAGVGKREIDEAQAAIVRRIYTEYAAGVSPRVICRALNAEGIKTGRGGEWRLSALLGSAKRLNGLLNNPIYIGKPVFNRQRFVKDPETGKRISRANPESAWIRQETPDLRIVSDELFAAAASRRAASPSHGPHTYVRRPKSLLSGLVRCEECGSPMTLYNSYFRCVRQYDGGTCQMNLGIKVQKLEAWIFAGLSNCLDDQELVREYVQRLHEAVAELRAQKSSREAADAKRRQDIDRKIANILVAIEDGEASPSLTQRLTELEREKAGLTEPVRKSAPTVVTLIPDAAARMRRSIAELQRIVGLPCIDGVRAREAVRALLSRIGARRENGQIRIEVDGNLGTILNFVDRPESVGPVGCGSPQQTVPSVPFPLVRRVSCR